MIDDVLNKAEVRTSLNGQVMAATLFLMAFWMDLMACLVDWAVVDATEWVNGNEQLEWAIFQGAVKKNEQPPQYLY